MQYHRATQRMSFIPFPCSHVFFDHDPYALIIGSLTFTSLRPLAAGTVKIHPNAKTGAHHHGHLESVIYVVKGRARMRWGPQLEYVAEAGPGDFIYVPPYVPHQEINAKENEELECVLMRSDGEAIAVNLPDLVPVEVPEGVKWVDPTHPTGGV